MRTSLTHPFAGLDTLHLCVSLFEDASSENDDQPNRWSSFSVSETCPAEIPAFLANSGWVNLTDTLSCFNFSPNDIFMPIEILLDYVTVVEILFMRINDYKIMINQFAQTAILEYVIVGVLGMLNNGVDDTKLMTLKLRVSLSLGIVWFCCHFCASNGRGKETRRSDPPWNSGSPGKHRAKRK